MYCGDVVPPRPEVPYSILRSKGRRLLCYQHHCLQLRDVRCWDIVCSTIKSTNMSTTRLLTKQSVINIMQKRMTAPEELARLGKKVHLTIEGNGVVWDVKNGQGELVPSVIGDGTNFQKKIFNTRANSGIAMANPRNLELQRAGRKAELAGNAEEAHKQYQAFLRAVQLDFSVPTTSGILDKLTNGTDISAKLVIVRTENGSLLTIDPSTISVLEPAELSTTTFSFEDEAEEGAATVASEIESLKA